MSYKEELSFDSIYTTKLLKEQIVKMIQKEIRSLKYDKHVQAIVLDSTPNLGYVNISLSSNLASTPIPIYNVKVRDNVELRTDDEVYVQGINGSFTNMFVDCNKSMRTNSVQRIFSSIGSTTITNSNVETTVVGSGIGSLDLTPDFLSPGKSLRISILGVHSTTPTVDLTIRIKLDSQIIMATLPFNDTASADNILKTDIILTCRADGINGTVIGQGIFYKNNGSLVPLKMLTTEVVNTTIAHTLDVTAQYSSSSSAVSITTTNLLVELIN